MPERRLDLRVSCLTEDEHRVTLLDEPLGCLVRANDEGADCVEHHIMGYMSDVSAALLERNGLGAADVDLVIPHQANIRIIEAVVRKLDVDMDRVYVNVDRVGNTSAASIPIALTEAASSGRIRSGMKVLLTAFGGGFTWAAALLQF